MGPGLGQLGQAGEAIGLPYQAEQSQGQGLRSEPHKWLISRLMHSDHPMLRRLLIGHSTVIIETTRVSLIVHFELVQFLPVRCVMPADPHEGRTPTSLLLVNKPCKRVQLRCSIGGTTGLRVDGQC
jgi:hypothetical protein